MLDQRTTERSASQLDSLSILMLVAVRKGGVIGKSACSAAKRRLGNDSDASTLPDVGTESSEPEEAN